MSLKRWSGALLGLTLALSACGGGAESTSQESTSSAPAASSASEPTGAEASEAESQWPRKLTDMNGREVELPKPAASAFGAGPPATTLIYTFSADQLAGWNGKLSGSLLPYLADAAKNKPELGRASGKDGNFNPETLLDKGVDVIFDAGDLGEQYRQMADDLQAQSGIPTMQFSTDLDKLPEVYRLMGQVFDDAERAEELAAYVERIWAEVDAKASTIADADQVSVYYGQGDAGLATAGSGNIHARVIDMIGAKNAMGEAEKVSGRMDVDAEALLAADPDWVIVLAPKDGSDVTTTPAFSELRAVKDGKVLQSPEGPWPWMDGPPSVNQVLGVIWAAEAIYPDVYDFDVAKEVKEFYQLFYHVDLSDEDVAKLLEDSGFKR